MIEKQKHALVKTTEQSYQCTTCTWTWKWHPSDDQCPGVKRYSYGEVPAHLVSFTELRRRKLRPGGPAVGAYRRAKSPYDYLYFYDVNEAQPRRTASKKQREALDKARQTLKEKHTCKRCGYYDDSHGKSWYSRKYHHTVQGGLCHPCQHYLMWVNDRYAIENQMAGLIASDTPFVVLDTETTGLSDHPDAQVVEVGIVGRDGQVLFQSLIKPDITMPAAASEIHGLTDADLASAPPLAEVWSDIVQILTTHEIYCYNVEFDRGMLLASAARFNLVIPKAVRNPQRWHCVMLDYACYHGEWSSYWEKWKYQDLFTACWTLHVAGNDYHRAVGDAQNTLGVMRALAARSGKHPAPLELRMILDKEIAL